MPAKKGFGTPCDPKKNSTIDPNLKLREDSVGREGGEKASIPREREGKRKY